MRNETTDYTDEHGWGEEINHRERREHRGHRERKGVMEWGNVGDIDSRKARQERKEGEGRRGRQ